MVAPRKEYEVLSNNPNLKIESIFAFVAESEEGEGIMAASMPINGQMMMMPMVGADLARVKSLMPIAKEISKASGRKFKVYRFDNKVDITEEL